MEFEWDETKRRKVYDEREVEFAVVALVFDDDERLTMVDTKGQYGEERYVTLGRVNEDYYIVVYTPRRSRIRIVTAWRAGADARRRFETLYNRRAAGEK